MAGPALSTYQAGTSLHLDWATLPAASATGRYLVDQAGNPWLMLATSPQGLLVTLTVAQADDYLKRIAALGFNCCQVHVIAGPGFGGAADSATNDGGAEVHPFDSYVTGSTWDITDPNETYFARLDSLVKSAASYGIVLLLDAAEYIDNAATWTTNDGYSSGGHTYCYNWGAWLATRYAGYPNIIWCVGNDFQDWSTNAAARAALLNVVDGLQSVDTTRPITAWLDYYHSASRDWATFDGKARVIDLAYQYFCAYPLTRTERAKSPAKPVFLGESFYQDYNTHGVDGTAAIIRRQNYWTMLTGGCGVTVQDVNWQPGASYATYLAKACFTNVQHLKALFEAYDWPSLADDSSHTYLTAGYGTELANDEESTHAPDNDFAACAYIAGTLALIYMPSNRTMTVDMSQFSGTVTCRWFDPTDGSYTADAASPHANSGTHDFSRATANAAGDADWVLVLEVA